MLAGPLTQFESFHVLGPTVHPGEIVRAAIHAAGMSQKAFADETGFTAKHLSQIVRGHALYSEEFAVRSEAVFTEASAEFWMDMRSRWVLKEAREKLSQESEDA